MEKVFKRQLDHITFLFGSSTGNEKIITDAIKNAVTTILKSDIQSNFKVSSVDVNADGGLEID